MREEKEKEELPLEYHQYVPPKIQDQFSPGEEVEQYSQKEGYALCKRKTVINY
jgi:hypothetical protein